MISLPSTTKRYYWDEKGLILFHHIQQQMVYNHQCEDTTGMLYLIKPFCSLNVWKQHLQVNKKIVNNISSSKLGTLIFENFFISIPEFQIGDSSSSTWNLIRHSAWVTHDRWRMQHSRHDAAVVGRRPLTSGMTGKLRRSQITNRVHLPHVHCSGSRVLSDPTETPLLLHAHHTLCCNHPTMNSPSHANWLGPVYSLVDVYTISRRC